ncbi:MAG: carboxypeptidase regulatory-like domain-containing protein [Verrucomicrobiota bacterium]
MKTPLKVLVLVLVAIAAAILIFKARNRKPDLPFAVGGRVLAGDTGEPIPAGLQVFMVTNGEAKLVEEATADAAGGFFVGLAEAGHYMVVGQASGFTGGSQSVNLSAENPKADVLLRLDRAKPGVASDDISGFRCLAGRVTEESGVPVPTAKLRLYGFDPSTMEFNALTVRQRDSKQRRTSVQVNQDGLYEMFIAPASLSREPFTIAHCSAPGYATVTANPMNDSTNLDFTLSRNTLTVEGVVLNAFDSTPVFDALVRFFVNGTNDSLLCYEEATTGPNGRLTIGSLPHAKEVAYLAGARGYVTTSGKIATEDKQSVEQIILLQPGGKVAGVVLDSREKTPVVAATVHCIGQLAALSAKTQDDGRFALDGVPFGQPLRLEAEADGFQRKTVDESAGIVAKPDGAGDEVVILLEPAVQIVGRVSTEEGELVADALVKLQGQEDDSAIGDAYEQTSERGEFKFAAVTPKAKCVVTAEHPAYDSVSQNIVTPQTGELKISLVVSNGGGLAGRVFYDDGTPAPGFTVRSALVAEIDAEGVVVFGRQKSADTGKDGKYAIRGLRPGRHLVSLFDGNNTNFGEQECVILNRVVHQMDFRIPRPGALAGAILDSEGKPFTAGCKLSLTAEDNDYSAQQEIQAGVSEYAFSDLQPGPYQLVAKGKGAGDFGPVKLEVRSGKVTALDVQFAAELFLEGVVKVDSDGSPVPGAQVEIFTIDPNERPMNPGRPDGNETGGMTTTDERGAFKVGGISAGYYKLWVSHPQFVSHAEDVDYREKLSPTKEILLSKGSVVTAAIVDLEGKPVTGATVVLGSRPTHERYLKDMTSRDGLARFEIVPPGAYELWVVFSSPDGTPKRVDVPLELADGEHKQLQVMEPKE